jgi:hypothetical protein
MKKKMAVWDVEITALWWYIYSFYHIYTSLRPVRRFPNYWLAWYEFVGYKNMCMATVIPWVYIQYLNPNGKPFLQIPKVTRTTYTCIWAISEHCSHQFHGLWVYMQLDVPGCQYGKRKKEKEKKTSESPFVQSVG